MIEVDVLGVVTRQLSEDQRAAAFARLDEQLGHERRSQRLTVDPEYPAVRLRNRASGRLLEITIGTPEAMAISMGLHRQEVPRPMTHDFVGNLLAALDATPVRAVVTRLVDGTFYGELVVRRGDEEVAVDCRPSDGIAVAVRYGVPVAVDESLDTEFAA
jgi:bifunctional DNase/RNase